MNSNANNKNFKGGSFVNRYKITATLTTESPLHIGSGDDTIIEIPESERKPGEKTEKKITKIITDYMNKPIIPGSAIKGAMRHWLENILRSINPVSELIGDKNRINNKDHLDPGKESFKDDLKNELKIFDLLFGSTRQEAKLEFWDACYKPEKKLESVQPKLLNWDSERLIYHHISVAIDPKTGTAADRMLYDFELVPVGVKFVLTICGQNLDPAELGLLLFALEGFNSEIYPLTLGAMGARGFGRFKLDVESLKIHRLDKDNLPKWMEESLVKPDAGYSSIKPLDKDETKQLITLAKDKIIDVIKEVPRND